MLYEVVGVVADAVFGAVGEDPTPVVYRPLRQEYPTAAAIVVRTTGDPQPLLGELRSRLRAAFPNMPLRNVGTISEQIDQGLWAPRMGAALLAIFGALAFVLAMIGIYGVMAYTVAQRTQEIGFRIAIGAQRADVFRLVIGQGMALAMAGLGVGLVLAVALGRLIAELLFGIRPYDPPTLLGVAADR